MLRIKAGLPEPSKPEWTMLPPGARDAITAKLLPKAIHVWIHSLAADEGCVDVCGPCHLRGHRNHA